MKKSIVIVSLALVYILQAACSIRNTSSIATIAVKKEAGVVLKEQILATAAWAMLQKPVTVTATSSIRSAGGKHDFFFRSRLLVA